MSDPTADHRAALRDAWQRAGHPGWITNTQGHPGSQKLRVYLALVFRGIDWGNSDWPLDEEHRLFYESEQAAEEDNTNDDDYRSNPRTDGLAGGICGLVLALGAAISLGWIHL